MLTVVRFKDDDLCGIYVGSEPSDMDFFLRWLKRTALKSCTTPLNIFWIRPLVGAGEQFLGQKNSKNCRFFNIFDDLGIAWSCLKAETFFVETSDINSSINIKKLSGTLWQKIGHFGAVRTLPRGDMPDDYFLYSGCPLIPTDPYPDKTPLIPTTFSRIFVGIRAHPYLGNVICFSLIPTTFSEDKCRDKGTPTVYHASLSEYVLLGMHVT